MMNYLRSIPLLYLLALSNLAFSHSWIERAYVVVGNEVNGEAGFPRGNGVSLEHGSE